MIALFIGIVIFLSLGVMVIAALRAGRVSVDTQDDGDF